MTSPLYVYPSMQLKSPTEDDYLGIYSIIFWTLSLIGVVKYAWIALKADDQGEGKYILFSSLRHSVVHSVYLVKPNASRIHLQFQELITFRYKLTCYKICHVCKYYNKTFCAQIKIFLTSLSRHYFCLNFRDLIALLQAEHLLCIHYSAGIWILEVFLQNVSGVQLFFIPACTKAPKSKADLVNFLRRAWLQGGCYFSLQC